MENARLHAASVPEDAPCSTGAGPESSRPFVTCASGGKLPRSAQGDKSDRAAMPSPGASRRRSPAAGRQRRGSPRSTGVPVRPACLGLASASRDQGRLPARRRALPPGRRLRARTASPQASGRYGKAWSEAGHDSAELWFSNIRPPREIRTAGASQRTGPRVAWWRRWSAEPLGERGTDPGRSEDAWNPARPLPPRLSGVAPNATG